MLGIVAVGVVRSPENFQGNHVHCAVIFAIAQLSCPSCHSYNIKQ